ncbi:MAG: glycosyltransferase [Bacteroidales bacterium]|jgi:glycosyltransferase involved in cell wall biosynthesis|nr:glycosyltransferase [Bacteroidales bacterium]
MKISIIIPIYNVSEHIIRCINSVINQTYQHFECILIDDCSPDNSIELATQRLETYNGSIDFKIIHHTQNKGLSGARNTGTLASTGEYVYYLDSDDEITPDCMETLITLVTRYPKVEMVQGNTQTIPASAEQDYWLNLSHKNFPEYVNDNDWIKRHLYDITVKTIPPNACNKLIKRDFIFAHNLFFKEGIVHEDELWMFWVVKKLRTIAFTTKYTYIAYGRTGSIMRSGNNYKSIQSELIILQEVFTNIDVDYSKELYKKGITRLFINLTRINMDDEREKVLYAKYQSFIRTIIRKISRNNKQFLVPLHYLLLPQYCLKGKIFKIIV